MKKSIFLSLILIVCISSCDKDENDCHPESVTANWNIKKEILVEYDVDYERYNYCVVDGSKLLFEYHRSSAQCDNIYDDEWGERLIFQLENNPNNFEYIDDEILLLNCFYQQYGAWVNHNQYQVKKGIIKGEKISDNEWKIDVNIEPNPLFENEQPQSIDFIEIFVE